MVNEDIKNEEELESTETQEEDSEEEPLEVIDDDSDDNEDLDEDDNDIEDDEEDEEDEEDDSEEDDEEEESKKDGSKKAKKPAPKKEKSETKSSRKRKKGKGRKPKKLYRDRLKNSPKIKRIEEDIQNVDSVDRIKAVRDKFNDQTGDYINKIKKIQNEINELQDQAYEYKKKRDDLNEKVSHIKNEKYKIIDELKAITSDLRVAKKNGGETQSGENWRDVRKKIYSVKGKVEQLERRIETEDLELGEENKLVDKIGHYEQKLQHLYSLKPKNQFKDYYDKIGTKKERLETIKDELSKLADESQNWHLLYIDLSKEISDLQNDKNLLQRELNENKYVADIYHNRLVEVSQDVKKQKIIQKKSQYRNKKKAKKEIRKITLKDAKEKLEKGKKLNIFEARAIMEDRVNN